MPHSDADVRGAIGREDRLVRAGVSLSLILMGVFALAGAAQVGLAVVGFALLAGYFAVTAAVGRDPLYARWGVTTRQGQPSDTAQDQGAATEWRDSLLGR